MNAKYIIPSVEVIQVSTFLVMTAVSGPNGMKDGGQDDGNQTPQAPGRRVFPF